MWIDHLQHFFSLVVYKGVKPEENIPDITCFILIYTVRELIWLIGKHSPLSLTNKLLIYKMVLKPIWTYGLALLGLRCIIQSSHYPAVPSEDSPTNHQCPTVRNKSYLTQGSAYPTRPNCPSGTNRHSSHSTAISPKPTDGTNPPSAKQQAIAKKMDT